MIRAGVQSLLLAAGQSACYALCIIEIACEVLGGAIDIVKALIDGIEHGFIRYKWGDPADEWNFYVDEPAHFLSLLAGGVWTVHHGPPGYQPQPGEYVVERWERQVTGRVIGHFRRPEWDSLTDSQTVRFGKVVSTRVFRRVG